MTSTEVSFFLQLPAEIRLQIYSHAFEIQGTMVIYTNYQVAKAMDVTVVRLMGVSQLIREEVQQFFYNNQAFEFRSLSSIDTFILRTGPECTAMIKDITFTRWMVTRLKTRHLERLLAWLPNLEHFTLMIKEDFEYIAINFRAEDDRYRLGPKTSAILRASKKLADGKVWFNCTRQQLRFTPSSVSLPTIDLTVPADWQGMRPRQYHELQIPESFKLEHEARMEQEAGDETGGAHNEEGEEEAHDLEAADVDVENVPRVKRRRLQH